MTEKDPLFDRFFDSMESLADAISESLQSQVTIEDSNHHVIGYSSHQFESDSARISTIIGKRVPNAVIIGLRKKGIMQQLESATRPIRIPAVMEVGLGPRLAICIKHQKEILGYIWVVDAGNLVEGHAENIVEKAAAIVGRYILKQRGWKTKQEKTQEDFSGSCSPPIMTMKRISSRTRKFGRFFCRTNIILACLRVTRSSMTTSYFGFGKL